MLLQADDYVDDCGDVYVVVVVFEIYVYFGTVTVKMLPQNDAAACRPFMLLLSMRRRYRYRSVSRGCMHLWILKCVEGWLFLVDKTYIEGEHQYTIHNTQYTLLVFCDKHAALTESLYYSTIEITAYKLNKHDHYHHEFLVWIT